MLLSFDLKQLWIQLFPATQNEFQKIGFRFFFISVSVFEWDRVLCTQPVNNPSHSNTTLPGDFKRRQV